MDRFNLKPMSKDAVPAALAKAERYRLLNEPGEAESICLDILQVDPQNLLFESNENNNRSVRIIRLPYRDGPQNC